MGTTSRLHSCSWLRECQKAKQRVYTLCNLKFKTYFSLFTQSQWATEGFFLMPHPKELIKLCSQVQPLSPTPVKSVKPIRKNQRKGAIFRQNPYYSWLYCKSRMDSTVPLSKSPLSKSQSKLSKSLSHFSNKRYLWYHFAVCLPPLFFSLRLSFCLFLFVCICLDQEAACASSTAGKLCLNFEAGYASPQGCLEHSAPVALQRGGQWDR